MPDVASAAALTAFSAKELFSFNVPTPRDIRYSQSTWQKKEIRSGLAASSLTVVALAYVVASASKSIIPLQIGIIASALIVLDYELALRSQGAQ